MTMTREQAITTYVENLSKGELVELLQYMNGYDGCFEDCVYYDRQFYMCNRLATMDPEMFMLTYCIKCEEE